MYPLTNVSVSAQNKHLTVVQKTKGVCKFIYCDAYIVWPGDGTDSFILYHISINHKVFEQLVTSVQYKDGIPVKNVCFSLT